MSSTSFVNARRVFAAVIACACVSALGVGHVSAQSALTVPGTAANQPGAPVKLVSCAAVVTGTAFYPQVVFDAPSNLKSSTVTYAFFNKKNVSLGEVDVSPPYSKKTYPLSTDTFSCAIAHEDLADGSVFPAVAHNNTGLVLAGLAGVGIIAALASHGGSSSTPSQTPPPTTAAPATPSPTPTATLAPGATPTPSPTPTATLAPGQTPSPSPTPTVKPTATPTATGVPTATASPTPTPTPSPVGVLQANPNTMSFTSTGANMSATIMETGGYTGTFTVTSNCASGGAADGGAIATISAGPYANPDTVMVTSGEAGTCTFTFKDTNGNIAQIVVQVTLSNVVVNGKHRTSTKTAPAPKPQIVPVPRSGSSIVPRDATTAHKV